MKYGTEEFINRLYYLADKIEAPRTIVAQHAGVLSDINNEYHVVELSDGTFEWYYRERGDERLLAKSKSVDDLMYAIFKSITHSLASEHECAHRVDGQDFRIILFEHQLFLMMSLNQMWHKKLYSRIGVLIEAMKRQDIRVRERTRSK